MRLSLALSLLPALPIWASTISGKFNLLSFNIAGLPAIFNSNGVPGDKSTNAEIVGSKFAQYGYDVIQLQEDFNYHAYVYKTDNHTYRTSTSGGVPFGSGLNTLSNYPWVEFQRFKWNKCSDIAAADCLTPKGFTAMRIRLAEGVYVDFYNIHADASNTDLDVNARTDNLQQVADHIEQYSAGNAVVLSGDTNSLYTLPKENIRVFKNQNLMKDVWVERVRNGKEPRQGSQPVECSNPTTNRTCETLDKILYRGSRLVNLESTYFGYEDYKFLNDGSILSDHNPITGNFTWSLSSSLRQTDLFGGPHGYFHRRFLIIDLAELGADSPRSWFNDLPSIPETSTGNNKPHKISLRGDERVDAVRLTLVSGKRYTHGGTGGSLQELVMEDNEYWTKAKLCRGKHNGTMRNFYLAATTNAGKTVAVGEMTADCQEFDVEDGWQIVGFYGEDGDEIDQLGFITARV